MIPRGAFLGLVASLLLLGAISLAQDRAPVTPEGAMDDLSAALGGPNPTLLVRTRLPLQLGPELAQRAEAAQGSEAIRWRYLTVRLDPDSPLAARQSVALERALRHGPSEDRFLAAAALAWMGNWDPAVLDELMTLAMAKRNSSQREEALMLIGSMGTSGEPLLPALAKEFLALEKAGEWERLVPLSDALWQILNDVPQVPQLDVPKLTYDYASRGIWLLCIQAEKGVAAEESRARLMNIARGDEEATMGARMLAIRAIPQAFTDEQEGLAAVASLLKRRRMIPLMTALVAALGDFGSLAEDYTWELLPLMESDDVDLRAETAATLFRICPTDEVALTLVVEMPEAQFGHYRSVILPQFAAAYLEDGEIRELLRQLLNSTPLESEAMLGALNLLPKPQPDLVPDLFFLLGRRHRKPREIALAGAMVARWQGDDALPVLVRLARNSIDWDTRRSLLPIIARFDGPEAEEALLEARRDPNAYVRQTALNLLLQPRQAR